MMLVNLQNVSKNFGAQTVLKDVSFQINSSEKLGLIGPNGAGKTTVLRIIVGKEEASAGNVAVARGARIGYVPQHVEYPADACVMDCVLETHRRLTAALRREEERLASAGEADVKRAMRAYERARDAYDHINGDTYVRRADAMLDALGLAGRGDQRVSRLSGGEMNVLALAQALLAEPDLLLLDEPANHLDYVGVAWLEGFLSRFKGAVLIVSHNRYLLDRVVQGILHLEGGTLARHEGNYSAYRAGRLRQLVAQQEDYIANQKRLAQLEALVQKFAEIARGHSAPAWGKRLRARRAQLEREKAQAVEKPMLGSSAIQPDFSTQAPKAHVALQLRGYSRAFGDLKLFDEVDLDIACGERVALIGPNGCGKTTLLRDVVETAAWENAVVRIGPSLTIGYCAQQQEVLKGDRTVLDEILAAGRLSRRDAHGVLARFLFGPDDLGKVVQNLSGGERNRLQLARLMVQKPNFLILDEPTNHLDIQAREAVEDALADYEGTILVVSHDRYFLDKVVERVVEVRDRKLVSYAGGFSDFWQARRLTELRSEGRVARRSKDRERAKERAIASKAVRDLERRISSTEQEKAELERGIEQALARHDRSGGRRLARQLERLQERIDGLYQQWLQASS